MFKNTVALIIISAMLISPSLVFAFGLGEIKINSALNEPMDAEIALVGFNASQIDEVQIELAPQSVFERVGVPRPYILTRLKFTPTVSRGKPVIKITSSDTVREPFLTFLIDVRWAKGKLLREYTVLLDPPVLGDRAKASVQEPRATSQSAPTTQSSVQNTPSVAPAPVTRKPATSVRPKRASVPKNTSSAPAPLKKTQPLADTKAVRTGDTLWRIAKPFAEKNGVSVNQMMLAIQSTNPESFSGNNINNLKSGTVLRIPADNLSSYTAKEALAEVQRQTQVWKQGTTSTSSTAVNVDAGSSGIDSDSSSSSTISQRQQSNETESKLSILGKGEATDGVSGDDSKATLSDLRRQVSLLNESAQSKDQENTELQDRIQSLESMIKKQEDIISLQNEQLAQLQNSVSLEEGVQSKSGLTSEATEQVMNEVEEELASTQDAVEGAASEGLEAGESVAEQSVTPATVESLPDFSEPIPKEFLNADQEASESLIAEAEVETVTQQAADSDGKAVNREQSKQPSMEAASSDVAQPDVAQESFVGSMLATLKQQSRMLLAAGGVLVGLLALLFWNRRRQANKQTSEIEASGLPAFSDEPTVGDSLDDTVVATPDSVDEALDELETLDTNTDQVIQEEPAGVEDSDDTLAEADVYISYGLYQQAEELLKEGLAKDPENAKYQFKLAEIYHGDKKSDEFVQHVESIEAVFDKQSPEWSKIVAMGAALAPTHALFADSGDEVSELEGEPQAAEENINDAVDELEEFDNEQLVSEIDNNSLDFTFDDDNALSELNDETDGKTSSPEDTSSIDNDLNNELEESSTAILDSEQDLDSALYMSGSEPGNTDDKTEVFLDFDQNELESELNSGVDHDRETEMLDDSEVANANLDDAINLDEDIETATEASASDGISIDNDLDEILENDNSETAMFDSSVFDDDNSETAMFDSSLLDVDDADDSETQTFAEQGDKARSSEDTESLEQVQENLTAELETLSFDGGDIDADSIEEESLPTLQTSEVGKLDFDLDDMGEDLKATETGDFEKDMMSGDATEQFDAGDVSNIDATMTDFGEFGEDYELENSSVIEEAGTKLDLAKAFVDMGDEDAAKETLTEVIEQGDQTQIQQAKDLLDKLS